MSTQDHILCHSLPGLDGLLAYGVECVVLRGHGAALEPMVLADAIFFCRSTAGTDNAVEKEKRGQGEVV